MFIEKLVLSWRMEDSFIPQSSHGIMDEQEEDLGSFSSFEDDDDEEEAVLSMNSSSSDLMEDATSSPSNDDLEEEEGSLFKMSSLIAQLPLKRGLSKHFQGKSQSFSSLCNVRGLEDLVKPERPYKKKLKSSKSYGGGLDCHKALSFTRAMIKKPSRGSFSSLGPKRLSFFSNNRPPIPPQRSSGNLLSESLLFA